MPYSGTGASLFHAWPRTIGSAEVCPIQLPGRENRMREPAIESYDVLADLIATALEPYMSRTCIFFGHCASAYLALETTRALELRDVPPTRLVVSSMLPPNESSKASILATAEEDLAGEVEKLMRARGFDPAPEFVELALEPMKSDVRALRAFGFKRRTPIATPIKALAWRFDEQVGIDVMERWQTFGAAETVVLDGTHWSFVECPEALRRELTRSCRPAEVLA